VLSQITVALLGRNAIAGERADRSAEFVAYLPLSRTRLWIGKLSVAAFAVALIWVVNILALCAIAWIVPEIRRSSYSYFPDKAVLYVTISGAVFYGVSWLISSFQSSPTVAVGGGLISPVIILLGLSVVAWAMGIKGPELDRVLEPGYLIIGTVLAVVCYSIGTVYYLRRVEP